jgi:Kelch motif protein
VRAVRRALVGIVVVVLAAACGDGGGTSAPKRAQPPYMQASPPSPRNGAVIASNGDRVLVFGGYTIGVHNPRALDDGWLYDLERETWTHVPRAPFERTPEDFPQPVAIGDDFLVFARTCSHHESSDYDTGCGKDGIEGAMFDPQESRWHAVDVPTALAYAPGRLGTFAGAAYLQAGKSASRQVWRYRADVDEWSEISLPFDTYETCLGGSNLFAFTLSFRSHGRLSDKNPLNLEPGEGVSMVPGDGFVLPRFARRDLSAADGPWEIGAPAPEPVFESGPPMVTCGASAGFVADYQVAKSALRYDASSRAWTDVHDALAARLQVLSGVNVAQGDVVLFFENADSAAPIEFDLANGRVLPTELPTLGINGSMVWNGDRVVAWTNAPAAKGGHLELARVHA